MSGIKFEIVATPSLSEDFRFLTVVTELRGGPFALERSMSELSRVRVAVSDLVRLGVHPNDLVSECAGRAAAGFEIARTGLMDRIRNRDEPMPDLRWPAHD